MRANSLPEGVLVSPEDLSDVLRYKWRVDSCGYVSATLPQDRAGKQAKLRLHRYVMKASASIMVDHINGDRKDNRRSNLRFVTCSENLQNRTALSSNNTSGYRGVRWSSQAKKWSAQATVAGKFFHLGFFVSRYDAAIVAHEWRVVNMPAYTTPSEIFALLDERAEIRQ